MSSGLTTAKFTLKILGIKEFNPITSKSINWVNWITHFGPRTCTYCKDKNGKVYERSDPPDNIPVHDFCNCEIKSVESIQIGTATMDGKNGADNWLYICKSLPNNYVTKEVAKKKGWINVIGNLRKVMPGATIGGNRYYDYSKKLPESPGRMWYEADINYTGGYRNGHRILYSNDGLMFATYDHYETFYELTQEVL